MSILNLQNKIYFIIIVSVLVVTGFLLISSPFKTDESSLHYNYKILNEKNESVLNTVNVKEELNVINKILLIGIDGADKNEIDRLISSGKLTNLQGLIKNGAYGNLKSIKPLLSPIIWTSIITGKEPLEHGITDFLAIDKNTGNEIPVTSNLRKVKTLWNIFSDYNKDVGIVGWLVTWPAEIINGVMVSDHITYLDYNPHQNNLQFEDYLVYPNNIIDEIKSKISEPSSISYSKLTKFLQVDKQEFELQIEIKESKLYDAISVVASTETIKNISLHLYNKNQPELFCIYFKGIDSFCHLFAGDKYNKTKSNSDPISQFYIYQDNILGEILKLTDENTIIFVVSDHGFKLHRDVHGSPEIGKGNAVDWHNDEGIIIVSGNNIKNNLKIDKASVMDVAPTILYLSGLPVAEDFNGRVLTELIDENYLKKNPIKKIKSFENKTFNAGENPKVSERNEEIKEELETLGYLNTGTANSYNNIGNLYMNQGNFKLAVQSFKKAVELAPDVGAYYDNLGSAYKELKLFDDAIKAHKKAISLDPYSAKAYSNLGRIFAEKNEFVIALQNYNKAIQLNPSLAEAYNNVGELYHKQGKIEEALSSINKAIQISPDHSLAHYNLAVLLGEKNNHSEAIQEFQEVLKINPEFYLLSNVYNGMGIAYFKLQEYEKALAYFNKTLEKNSSFHEIYLRLGITYIMMGKKEKGINHLREELKISPSNKELADLIKKLEDEKEK